GETASGTGGETGGRTCGETASGTCVPVRAGDSCATEVTPASDLLGACGFSTADDGSAGQQWSHETAVGSGDHSQGVAGGKGHPAMLHINGGGAPMPVDNGAPPRERPPRPGMRHDRSWLWRMPGAR